MRDRDAIYREILGILRDYRNRARWHCDRAHAAAAMAHLMLIPPLLNCSDETRHRHYVEVECPRFARECHLADQHMLDSLREELNEWVAHRSIPLAQNAGPIHLGYCSPNRVHAPWKGRQPRS